MGNTQYPNANIVLTLTSSIEHISSLLIKSVFMLIAEVGSLLCCVFIVSGERSEVDGPHRDRHAGHIAGLVHAVQNDRSEEDQCVCS